MKYEVIKEYKDAPINPLSISQNETLVYIEESDPEGDWPNWILCRGIDKEGWIPKQILEINDSIVLIKEDYSAKEHNLNVGEILQSERELNGWILCKKEDQLAWAPLNHLKKVFL